jgi:hypothetical protein
MPGLLSQQTYKTFKAGIKAIKEEIESGATLSDSLKKYPKIFDELFVNLVAAGESGGILDVILQRLSNYMEKAMKLKAKVKGAMTYPASVLVISIGVVVSCCSGYPRVPESSREGGELRADPVSLDASASRRAISSFMIAPSCRWHRLQKNSAVRKGHVRHRFP